MSEKKRTSMIVEDDHALQKQMRWAFDRYDTVVASDREAAVAQFRRHEPAVVTMDLGLPPDPDGVIEGTDKRSIGHGRWDRSKKDRGVRRRNYQADA